MPIFSKVQMTGLAAAAAIASAALFAPAAAAQPAQPSEPTQQTEPDRGVGQITTGSNILVIGAIKDRADRSAPVAADPRVPELPVVYEDAKAPAPANAPAAVAPPASAARR